MAHNKITSYVNINSTSACRSSLKLLEDSIWLMYCFRFHIKTLEFAIFTQQICIHHSRLCYYLVWIWNECAINWAEFALFIRRTETRIYVVHLNRLNNTKKKSILKQKHSFVFSEFPKDFRSLDGISIFKKKTMKIVLFSAPSVPNQRWNSFNVR